MKHAFLRLALLFVCAAALLAPLAPALAQELSEYGNRLTWVTLGKVRVHAEVVDTPEKTYLGLSYRQQLPEGRGMLFLMPREEYQQFCMRGMQFAIDIIWIGRGRVAGIAANVQPTDQSVLESPEPVHLVLEVPGGFCRRHGIAVGAPVALAPDVDGKTPAPRP